MIIYLLKCTIAMGISWFVYRTFLSKQKSFLLNRIYLLIAAMGSVLAPLVMLPSIMPDSGIINNIHPFLYPTSTTPMNSVDEIIPSSAYSLSEYASGFILSVSILLAIRFIWRLSKMIRLYQVPTIANKEGIRIAIINDNRTPFSFFNKMYVDQESFEEGIENEVLFHEKNHIQQWHSIDRIIVEIISIVQWMNPFLYLLKRDLIDNHEYASDAYAIRQTNDSQNYLSLILKSAQSSSAQNFLLQRFNHSSSIKRIRMITTNQKNRQLWIYPFAFSLLLGCFGSCSDDFEDSNLYPETSFKANSSNSSIVSETIGSIFQKMFDGEIPFPPINGPRINRPPNRLFSTWKDDEKFGIFIDQQRSRNNVLALYSKEDFSYFTVREIFIKDEDFGEYAYRVDLMTNAGYDELHAQQIKLRLEYKEKYPEIWSKLDLAHMQNLSKQSFF